MIYSVADKNPNLHKKTNKISTIADKGIDPTGYGLHTFGNDFECALLFLEPSREVGKRCLLGLVLAFDGDEFSADRANGLRRLAPLHEPLLYLKKSVYKNEKKKERKRMDRQTVRKRDWQKCN